MGDKAKAIAYWSGYDLWQKTDRKGIVLRNNGEWSPVVEGIFQSFTYDESYTRDTFINADLLWAEAFEKIIIEGVPPTEEYKGGSCSCGSWKVYGKDSEHHTINCSYNDSYINFLFNDAPKNNDNRDNCYFCKLPTITVAGKYQLCSNERCRWFRK